MNELQDLLAALRPVVSYFERAGIQHYVGGSVASSFHGAFRSTRDIDIVAKLTDQHVAGLIETLGPEYYVSESAVRDAIRRQSCFNLIHNDTSFKVDVFVSKNRSFDQSANERATPGELDPDDEHFRVRIASPEDVVISKLEWYRLGNEASERQWEDVSTVLRLLGDAADVTYLIKSADQVGVTDLLERLLEQSH